MWQMTFEGIAFLSWIYIEAPSAVWGKKLDWTWDDLAKVKSNSYYFNLFYLYCIYLSFATLKSSSNNTLTPFNWKSNLMVCRSLSRYLGLPSASLTFFRLSGHSCWLRISVIMFDMRWQALDLSKPGGLWGTELLCGQELRALKRSWLLTISQFGIHTFSSSQDLLEVFFKQV